MYFTNMEMQGGQIAHILQYFLKENGQNGGVSVHLLYVFTVYAPWNVLVIYNVPHIVHCRCKDCGGSGLSYCSRCLGTGEYRYIMGFHFMKTDSDQSQDTKRNQVQRKATRSAADLLEGEELDSSCER